MKRVVIRPGKSVIVSDEVFSRVRRGLQAFGAAPAALTPLAEFVGSGAVGAKLVVETARSPAKRSRPVLGRHVRE